MKNKPDKYEGYYSGILDGKKCPTLTAFLIEVGRAFEFPAYYGRNMNAFWECINDLSWLNENNYLMRIIHFDHFLNGEEKDLRQSVISGLGNITMEWANVPNYEGEEEYRDKGDFVIVFE